MSNTSNSTKRFMELQTSAAFVEELVAALEDMTAIMITALDILEGLLASVATGSFSETPPSTKQN